MGSGVGSPPRVLIPARTLLGLPSPHRIKRLHKTKEGSLLPY